MHWRRATVGICIPTRLSVDLSKKRSSITYRSTVGRVMARMSAVLLTLLDRSLHIEAQVLVLDSDAYWHTKYSSRHCTGTGNRPRNVRMIPSTRLGATLYKLDIIRLIAFRSYRLWLAYALAYIALASMSAFRWWHPRGLRTPQFEGFVPTGFKSTCRACS
jgi:hypothetical protein